MRHHGTIASIASGHLLLASCAPVVEHGAAAPECPTSPAPSGTSAGGAPDRVKIAGPEASKVTFDHIARVPPLGAQLPQQVQFSPSGKLITFLQKDPGDGRMALFAFDIAARTTRLLVRGADLGKDNKPISREEELRRERQRKQIQGVTSYQWAKKAPVMLLPFAGDMFLRAEDGAITRLTETPEPEIDPKVCQSGERVVFVRGRELFVVDVASRRETQLTKGAPEGVTRGQSDFNGQEEFNEPSGFWISPGCDRVAYLEVDEREVETVPVMGFRGGKPDLMMQRYPLAGKKNPKVRAGILDLATKKTTWLGWETDAERYLGRFKWSPDGKALWLQSLSRDQKRLALVRADPASGKTTELFVETAPTWVEFTEMKLLERSPRFVWMKPTGGHFHLELRDATSGAVVAPLTTGDWDVDAIVAVDEERGRVLFGATKDGTLDRNLYATPLAGGGKIDRLTTEPGTHFVAADPQGKTLVDLHSAADRAWKVVIRAGADMAVLSEVPVVVDAELSALGLRVPEFVQFKGPSGDMLHGAVLAPRTLEPGRRYPVAVMIYGGPFAQTVRNLWSSQQQLLWNHLADRNMVVFQLDNRGSAGRGRAFEETLHRKLGFVELEDQIAGLDHLKSLPYVDSSRVGIYGHSYGGSMVLHALLRAPDRFQVGVAVSPVTDHRLYDTGYTERYMETPATNAEGYAVTDLTKLAPKLRGKLLLMHGMMDENVHFENTALMIDAFIAADKPIDLMVFPGERHGYSSSTTKRYAMRRVIDYLAEHL